MFPVSIEGQVKLETGLRSSEVIERLFANIEAQLKAEKATAIRREAGKMTFRAGLFRSVSGWNALILVGSGEFEIVPENPSIVQYRFSTMQFFATVTIMSVLIGVLAFQGEAIWSHLPIAIPVWLFLFGLNYLLSFTRLTSFVQKAVRI